MTERHVFLGSPAESGKLTMNEPTRQGGQVRAHRAGV